MPTTPELMEFDPHVGRLEWIGLATEPCGPVRSLTLAKLRTDCGIVGEHHSGGPDGERQVTLIQAEHLPVIASLCGRERVEPELLRRNLVVAGINLIGLRKRRFRIGRIVLEGTGWCPPCGRLEETLGAGGFHAARGHAGIAARVIVGGTLRVGDPVQDLPPPR